MTDTNTQRALGRIEGSLKEIKGMLSNDRERLNDHGKRIAKVENRIYAVWVIGPVLLFLVGFAKNAKEFLAG